VVACDPPLRPRCDPPRGAARQRGDPVDSAARTRTANRARNLGVARRRGRRATAAGPVRSAAAGPVRSAAADPSQRPL